MDEIGDPESPTPNEKTMSTLVVTGLCCKSRVQKVMIFGTLTAAIPLAIRVIDLINGPSRR